MDAAQKAFLRIMKALPRFRLGEPFFPWFYRIVRNAALNQKRDEKRHKGEMPLEWVKQSDGRPSPLEVTVAEEVKDPDSALPRGMILALIVTTLVYVLGVLVVLAQNGEHTMGQLRDELDMDRAALTRVVAFWCRTAVRTERGRKLRR